MKVISSMKSLWGWLFDCFRMAGVNRRIEAKQDTWQSDPDFADIFQLGDADLDAYIQSEWERARELDSKLSKLTVATSIALTVGGTASKLIFDGYAPYLANIVSIALFCLAMLFFLMAAILGFNGLRPKPRYGYGARYLNIISKQDNESRKTKQNAAGQFQIMNMVRANEASAAIDFIRNGILIYALAMFASWLPAPEAVPSVLDMPSVIDEKPDSQEVPTNKQIAEEDKSEVVNAVPKKAIEPGIPDSTKDE